MKSECKGKCSEKSETGGGIAYNMEEFEAIVRRGLMYSLNSEVLVEESLEKCKKCKTENAVVVALAEESNK